MCALGDIQREIIQHHRASLAAQEDVADFDAALQMRDLLRRAGEQRLVHDARRIEPFGHHFPAQRHVLCLVVIIQQLFPRVAEVFVGRERRHQRTHCDLPLNGENAAHEVEEKGRQLGDEVVEKLHKEFFLKNLEPDIEQRAQTAGERGLTEAPAAVGAQIGNACRCLAYFRGQQANLFDPVLVQQVDLPLQDGNDVRLQRDECDARQPEPEGLQEQKYYNDQHLARLKDRLRQEISHQPAHWLCLGGDHADQLALRGFLIIAFGKPHHPRQKAVAEPPQQTLGHDTLHRVQPHLEQPVRQHCRQIAKAQGCQKLDLAQLVAVDVDHIGLGANRIVDDPLGQFQRGVEKRKGEHRHRQQNQLIPLGVLPDEGEEGTVHSGAFYGEMPA